MVRNMRRLLRHAHAEKQPVVADLREPCVDTLAHSRTLSQRAMYCLACQNYQDVSVFRIANLTVGFSGEGDV